MYRKLTSHICSHLVAPDILKRSLYSGAKRFALCGMSVAVDIAVLSEFFLLPVSAFPDTLNYSVVTSGFKFSLILTFFRS